MRPKTEVFSDDETETEVFSDDETKCLVRDRRQSV